MNIRAIIHEAEEGGFWAEVPVLPGCVTPEKTLKEIRKNIREAIDLWLEIFDKPQPIQAHDRVMEFAV